MPEVQVPRDKRKRPKHKAKQRRVKRYTKAREDVQLNGDIETVPVGAVRDERVDPSKQGTQPLPGLIGQAVRKGWATPEEVKPRIVDEMVDLIENKEVDHLDRPVIEAHIKVAAARVLQQADKDQWERDNPELAGKTRGGVNVGVEVKNQVNLIDLARQAAARPDPLEEAKREALEKLEEAKRKALEKKDGT